MLEFRTLGGVDIRGAAGSDEGLRVVSQPKRVALLAYLCVSRPRGSHSRDTLLGLFWPETTERRGRHALSQAIHFLRRDLGTDAIVTSGSGVGIDPEMVRCDVIAFESACEDGRWPDALGRYGGEFLAGLYPSGSRLLERWIDGERDRLRRLAVDAAIAAAGMEGEGVAASPGAAEKIRWLRSALEWSPFEEATISRLVRELARSGDRAGAIDAYGAFTRRFRAELGIEPSASVLALEAELRAAPPEIGPVAVEPAPIREIEPVAVVPATRHERAHELRSGRSEDTAGRRRPRRWARFLVPLGAAAVLGLALFVLRPSLGTAPALDPRGVLVGAFENRSPRSPEVPGALGSLVADQIARDLAGSGMVRVTPPPLRRSRSPYEAANQAGAGLLVTGSFRVRDDSIALEAELIDVASRRILRTIEPVPGEAADPFPAIAETGRRVAGALATILDDRLSSWAFAASLPPDLTSYRTFADGLDRFEAGDFEGAVARFEAAADADSTFLTPLVWIVFANAYADLGVGRGLAVVERLERHREVLAPWERAMLDMYGARLAGNYERAYAASLELLSLMPGSEWAFEAAARALDANRPRQALALLESVGADVVDPVIPRRPAGIAAQAHHRLGQFEAELEVARGARTAGTAEPSAEARALAAMGRVDGIRALADEIASRERSEELGEFLLRAAEELQAHGYPMEATGLLERSARLYGSPRDPRRPAPAARLVWARTLEGLGRWAEARTVLLELQDAGYRTRAITGELGVVAAWLGDRDEAVRISDGFEREEAGGHLGGWGTQFRVRIAAILGDRDAAIAHYAQALSEGWIPGMHDWLDRDYAALRDYSPFLALARPKP